MEWYRWNEKPVDGQRILVWFRDECCIAGRYSRRTALKAEGLDPLGGGAFIETNDDEPGCWCYLPLPPSHMVKVTPIRFNTGARK